MIYIFKSKLNNSYNQTSTAPSFSINWCLPADFNQIFQWCIPAGLTYGLEKLLKFENKDSKCHRSGTLLNIGYSVLVWSDAFYVYKVASWSKLLKWSFKLNKAYLHVYMASSVVAIFHRIYSSGKIQWADQVIEILGHAPNHRKSDPLQLPR